MGETRAGTKKKGHGLRDPQRGSERENLLVAGQGGCTPATPTRGKAKGERANEILRLTISIIVDENLRGKVQGTIMGAIQREVRGISSHQTLKRVSRQNYVQVSWPNGP